MADTAAPRRRGRPSATEGGDLVMPLASIESYTLGPAGIRVVIRFKTAMSSPTIDPVEVIWPHGWPLPLLNDAIKAGGKAGRVQYIEYDHDAGCIRIFAV